MAKQLKKSEPASGSLEPIYQTWAWVLLMWSLYRYFLHLPEWFDEFVAKPIVFIGPVLWYLKNKEHRTIESIGITGKNVLNSIYIGLGFCMVFAMEGIAAHAIKYGKLDVSPIAAFKEYGFFLILI